jgi:hypothetical protein
VRHGLLVTLVHSLLHAVREKAGAGWAARWGDGTEEIGQKRIREGGGGGLGRSGILAHGQLVKRTHILFSKPFSNLQITLNSTQI